MTLENIEKQIAKNYELVNHVVNSHTEKFTKQDEEMNLLKEGILRILDKMENAEHVKPEKSTAPGYEEGTTTPEIEAGKKGDLEKDEEMGYPQKDGYSKKPMKPDVDHRAEQPHNNEVTKQTLPGNYRSHAGNDQDVNKNDFTSNFILKGMKGEGLGHLGTLTPQKVKGEMVAMITKNYIETKGFSNLSDIPLTGSI